jgi:DNA-binding response OmpR family regulator
MKILIIEDEHEIARFLQQGLSEEGFTVSWEANGKKGLERAQEEAFDLLLLDWMLPDLSGIEICRSFRNSNSNTPIIMLTARDTSADVVEGLQAGANDYIRKPFHFAELLERIRVQLRSTSPSAAKALLKLGDIEMDLEAHAVYKSEQVVQLTKKEYALLEYLLRHPGRVCERAQILDSVWDSNYNYNEGIIDVYINNLRKKLDNPNQPSFIETIRGVGYITRSHEA